MVLEHVLLKSWRSFFVLEGRNYSAARAAELNSMFISVYNVPGRAETKKRYVVAVRFE